MSIANSMRAVDELSCRDSDEGGNPVDDRTQRLAVAVTLEHFIPGDIGEVFDLVATQDVLPKMLTRYGFVPGVTFTSNPSGPLDQPGSIPTVHLLDGSAVHEGITYYDRPSYFTYRVNDPSCLLKHLLSHAHGQ